MNKTDNELPEFAILCCAAHVAPYVFVQAGRAAGAKAGDKSLRMRVTKDGLRYAVQTGDR